MKSGISLVEMAKEIQRQAELKADYMMDTRSLRLEPFGSDLYLNAYTPSGELAANKAEIPSVDYYGNALTDGTPDIGANETVKKADEDAKPADGLGMDKDGNWFYYKDGKVDTAYTGLAANEYGWWYVEAGQINFNVTGLVNDST